METARFCEGASRVCGKCGAGDVQDEKHVLFHCSCEQVCDVRAKYADLFECMRCVHDLAVIPFVPVSVRIDNGAVSDFLGQDRVRLFKSISDFVTVFAD